MTLDPTPDPARREPGREAGAPEDAGDSTCSLSARFQQHPSVNSDRGCPVCGTRALHEQHCKLICLACGYYRSCSDP